MGALGRAWVLVLRSGLADSLFVEFGRCVCVVYVRVVRILMFPVFLVCGCCNIRIAGLPWF